MKVKTGDVVCSEFGEGPIVAITKRWIIQCISRTDDEVALLRKDEPIWLSDKSLEIGGGGQEEVETSDE